MNLKIRSQRLDLHEITNTDHQYSYIVEVLDATRKVIDAKIAYGVLDRTAVTRAMIAKHGAQYIVNIEHIE